MSSPQPVAPDPVKEASRSASECALAGIFPRGALVWIIDEQYETNGPVWRVTLVCQGMQGRWMRRRYRYDIPSGTLHYTGETPISDAELTAARRGGHRLVITR